MKPRYCAAFPCNRIATVGRYCEEHAREVPQKVADSFYTSSRWRWFRAWYLRQHPLCERCQAAGEAVPATVVHHIIELSAGGAECDPDNVQALCARCHNQVHGNRKKSSDRDAV
jgi:5-methylcytosine-specific restriction enzyme A